MNWPSPKDFNDAVRNPTANFSDPDLAAGDTVLGSNGRPLSHAGDSSAVYEVHTEDDRGWAVKCFAHPLPAIGHRYARIREALDWAAAPFAVDFNFLAEGLRVGEQRFPILKLDWVEGLLLNQVVRQRANSPAVMEALFQRWVQLCRELRRAGIAHGDLQHANVLLVPGAWPGAYKLKLIDYDGMYTPALAGTPSGEVGHANYQHPARAAEGTYSPDIDRFPLLVIATALKALAVLGPRLWERYDSGDNLLFRAADFRNPAASPLMRELWGTNNPALRTLVGKLVLACALPIPETPWLDEIAATLDAPFTADETLAVASVLGLGTNAPAPLAEAFTLDPEPEAAPVRRAIAKSLIPVEVYAIDEPSRKSLSPVVLIVAGLLLLAIGMGAGVLIARGIRPDETAQPKPNDSPATVAPAAPAPAAPAPIVTPPVAPPPPFVGPPGFHRVWAKPVVDEGAFVKVYFAAGSQTVFVAASKRLDAFDAKTGNPRLELRGPALPTVSSNVWVLNRNRVVAFGYPLKSPSVWDAKTGEPLPALFARDMLPPAPAGVNPTAIECQLSPDGRYVFAGYQGIIRNQTHLLAPYRVIETATGKVVVQGEWTYGTARFTADGSRMLMGETNGRLRWFAMPSGDVEVEWAFPPIVGTHIIVGMSADGSFVNYFGVPAGLPLGNYLLDGKTGQVLRRLGANFNGDRSVLSADGRLLAAVTNEAPDFQRFFAVITDTRTGEVLVRTPIEGTMNDLQRAAFTPDGKAFILHHRGKREAAVYELRGTIPEVPAGALVPEPLSAIPARVPPGGPAVVAPLPPPPPNGGLPEAPLLKSRWTIATDAGIMGNGLPQPPLYSKDGRTMILSGGSTGAILTFDPKTGDAGAVYEGHKGPGGVYWLHPVGGDRVVSGGFDGQQATWDTKTGKRVDEIRFPELPPMPDAKKGHAGITYAVSPGGRYTVAARKESGRPVVAGPLRVLDTTTDKEVLKADWNGGRILFTADESRVLVLDGLGKATWYKLPSGEADGEWATGVGIPAEMARVLGMTADGQTLLYHGPLTGQPVGVYLLNGKTGAVLRRLGGAPYQATWSALSPDGRFLVMSVIDFNRGPTWYADVFEVETWKLVGRIASPEKGTRGPAQFGFSPDGKDLSVFYPLAKELSVFTLP